MKKLRSLRSTLVLLFVILLFLAPLSPVASAQTKEQPAEVASGRILPTLCGEQHEVRFVADVNSTSASTQFQLCSPGNQKTIIATLTADDFTSRTTKLGIGTNVVFSRNEEKQTSSALKLTPIQVGEVTTVKVEVANFWEAGEAETPLRVNGVQIGTLVATKYRLPFGVEVDAPDPTKPEVILQRNQQQSIVLKNKDAVTYLIEWEFQVRGKSFSGKSVLTPSNSSTFTILPCHDLYNWFTGLLRDVDEDGKLTLSFRPPGVEQSSIWPSKVVSVQVHLRYCSVTSRAWIANTLLLVVLVFGAMISFLGSVGLPNRLKRCEYRENLGRLAQRIGGISHQVDSKLRVVVRVQRKRLSELLESRTSISADLNRVFDQVNQGIATVQAQVQVAERIDAAHSTVQYLDEQGAGPSFLTSAEEIIRKAAELVNHIGPTDQELNQAQKHLDDAGALMDRAVIFDSAFAQDLVARSTQLQLDLKGFALTPAYKKIQAALPGVFADMIVLLPPTRAAESSRLDRNLIKADLIRQFLQIYYVAENPEVRAQIDKQQERLLAALSLDSWDAIRMARLLVREVQEGVYPVNLVRAGHAGDAHIEIDPNVAIVDGLIRFGLSFGDPRFNTAAARQEFEGRWNFGHDEYCEIGWEPYHYLPRAGAFSVEFRFQSADDKEPVHVSRTVTVSEETQRWYSRDRNRAEIGRFAIALLPATFGLLAGAREQLLKMDLSSALFAVFLLGYGSDSIKNVVSQTQQSSQALVTPPVVGTTTPSPTGAAVLAKK